MKLWQKIFLSSLLLIIAAVNIVSLTLLGNSHKLILERERSHAVAQHDYFSSAFVNAATYEKAAQGLISVNYTAIVKVADNVVKNSSSGFMSAVYYDTTATVSSNIPTALNKQLHEGFISEIDPSGNGYISTLTTCEGKKLIIVGSAVIIDGNTYFIVTSADVSEIFALREKQADFVRKTSIAASTVISLILLVMTIFLLRPLNKLNIYTKAIAGGQYNIRIRKKGSREFRELAENMNIMAEAVQEHALHLENIAESRKTFIANLAHEMKTPLTSILGFGDLLRIKKKVSDSERVEYSSVIVEETKRLRSLSGKLMELAALGGTEIEKKPVSLKKLISDTAAALEPIVNKSEVILSASSEDIMIEADEELFKSLIYNIVENAVKASPKGAEIRLTAAFQQGKTVISVTDKGIGMTEDEAKHVFEPFYMADKSRSRKAGGAGLGLALCEKIAKLHDSTLRIESRKNEGTAVFIEIPGGDAK